MASIAISWIYITFVAFCLGHSFHHLLRWAFGLDKKQEDHFSIVCISGLFVIICITTFLCLFIPLGLLSNGIILCLALPAVLFNSSSLKEAIRYYLGELRKTPVLLQVIFLLFLVIFAYISYMPSSHYDDGLYYSTSIKWLQEYGTVKGLTNLMPRIGFNSSWLILQANFGFQFLRLGLFNDLNGLLFLYFFIYFLHAVNRLYKGDRSLPNVLQAFFLLPLLAFHRTANSDFLIYNVNLISSSSVDLPACMLLCLVFLLFAQTIGSARQLHFKELLIIFYSLSLLTIKLSTVPVLLFSVFILVKLIRMGKIRQPVTIILGGTILVLPWIIRNVLLSGYPAFPFSGIDVFHVDWKIPVFFVKYYEYVIRVYPIDPNLIAQPDFKEPLYEWIPGWFNRLWYIQRVILMLAALSTFIFMGIGIWQLLRRNRLFFKKNAGWIFFIITGLAGILFWLLKAPDFRFGFGFINIYCAFSLLLFFRFFLENRIRFLAHFVILFIFFVIFYYVSDYQFDILHKLIKPPIAYRQPRGMKIEKINHDQPVYVVDDDSWNAPLPEANKSDFYILRPALRGNTLKEGFKSTP